MMTLHRILCPVDFSESSQRALRHALKIARWHGSELTVLHVEDLLLYAASVEAGGHLQFTRRHYEELHDFVDRAGGKDLNVTVRVVTGDAASRILDYARRDPSDLIIMGTRGRSGLARAVLGSVAERVVRRSPTPVLTIPPSAQLADDLVPFDPILCASDFSAACRRALDLAIVIGQEADARLILLHALELPHLDPGSGLQVPISPRLDVPGYRTAALARLKRGLPDDAVFRCRPEAMVAAGRPADVILDTASREDVQLIVMGVQARSAWDRLLFGSTTRRVMQAATCPVLTIRAGDAAEAWPPSPHRDAGVGETVNSPETAAPTVQHSATTPGR